MSCASRCCEGSRHILCLINAFENVVKAQDAGRHASGFPLLHVFTHLELCSRNGFCVGIQVGGRLVYSTCTFNPIEDEAVVAEVGSAQLSLDASCCCIFLVAWKLLERHHCIGTNSVLSYLILSGCSNRAHETRA